MNHVPSSNLSKLALTSGLALAASGAAQAAIIATEQSTTLPASSPLSSLQFNLATRQVAIFPSNAPGTNYQFNVNYVANSNGTTNKPRIIGNNDNTSFIQGDGNYATRYQAGQLISTASYYEQRTLADDGGGTFPVGASGYVGLRIADPAVANQLDYGYAFISRNADQSITVGTFAYDNTGAAIIAGAVPEPSTYATGLLVLSGAAGAMAARRRRAAKSVA